MHRRRSEESGLDHGVYRRDLPRPWCRGRLPDYRGFAGMGDCRASQRGRAPPRGAWPWRSRPASARVQERGPGAEGGTVDSWRLDDATTGMDAVMSLRVLEAPDTCPPECLKDLQRYPAGPGAVRTAAPGAARPAPSTADRAGGAPQPLLVGIAQASATAQTWTGGTAETRPAVKRYICIGRRHRFCEDRFRVIAVSCFRAAR